MTEKLTYSVEEAAKRIGIGKNALYALAAAKKIPAIRVGRRYIINAAMFDDWFRSQSERHAEIEL